LRIIGGALRGKKLMPLRGTNIRPTADLVRESIFNILADRVEGAVVLDLFAGTGSLGIEALSRGAVSATFIDNARQAIETVSKNIGACQLVEKSHVFKKDILRGLGFLKKTGQMFDLVFMDPPYKKDCILETLGLLEQCACVPVNTCVIAEHSAGENLPDEVARFRRSDKRKYGNTLVSFYDFML
jgi:16S rRNA (guanine966-N2)-methyltransferase